MPVPGGQPSPGGPGSIPLRSDFFLDADRAESYEAQSAGSGVANRCRVPFSGEVMVIKRLLWDFGADRDVHLLRGTTSRPLTDTGFRVVEVEPGVVVGVGGICPQE